MAIPYNSNYDQTVPFSDTCAQVALAIGAELTYTVPGPATQNYSVRFGYNSTSNVYVRLNGTVATVPAGTATSTQYQELRPGSDGSKRYVKGGDVLHFITPDASAQVSIALMAIRS